MRRAHAAYRAALDREEAAAKVFAGLMKRVGHLVQTGSDDPLAGGRDSPDLASESVQLEDERSDVGENARSDFLLEERDSGAHNGGFNQSAIHGHHVGAHVVFANLASQVIGVTGTSPSDRFIGDQALTHLPLKEGRAGITRPERSIAVKDRQPRL